MRYLRQVLTQCEITLLLLASCVAQPQRVTSKCPPGSELRCGDTQRLIDSLKRQDSIRQAGVLVPAPTDLQLEAVGELLYQVNTRLAGKNPLPWSQVEQEEQHGWVDEARTIWPQLVKAVGP